LSPNAAARFRVNSKCKKLQAASHWRNAPLAYCELEFVCAWALCCGGGLSFEAFV
jgi:hypothetical protein